MGGSGAFIQLQEGAGAAPGRDGRCSMRGWWLHDVGRGAVTPSPLLPPQLSLKCRAPEVSQYVYQAYETILKN